MGITEVGVPNRDLEDDDEVRGSAAAPPGAIHANQVTRQQRVPPDNIAVDRIHRDQLTALE
jgi:hypothetical protein